MSLITRSADASVDASTAAVAPQISGLVAASDIDVAAPCYITSAGKVAMCDATAANELAVLAGFAPRAAKTGQPITLYGAGTRFRYGSGLTPGAYYYLGATAGRLDDAATTGNDQPVAQAVSATDIRVVASFTTPAGS